jgi:uncharacterized protein
MADSATLVASRPQVLLGGQVNDALTDQLLTMRVDASIDGLTSCEAVFANWGPTGATAGYQYADRSTLDFGKSLQVKHRDAVLFDGKISGLEGRYPEADSPKLAVLAEDLLQVFRLTRRTRTFEQVSDGDVARQLAGDHGLQTDLDMPGPKHRVLAQVNESDLAFLRHRARATGSILWLTDKTLHVKARDRLTGSPLALSWGSTLHEFTVLADLAHQCTAYAVTGWSVADKKAIRVDADPSVLGSELAGTSGAAALRSAFGARVEVAATQSPTTEEEAKALAESGFREQARRFVVGHGVAETRPELIVGVDVTIDRLGPSFDGRYHVEALTHRFDAVLGLRTEFRASRVGIGGGS